MTKTYIDELVEEIARLREKNNKLNEMCNYWSIEETERTMECYKLKQLLKECYKMLAQYHIENSEPSIGENIQLLTKIEEVLK